MSGLAIGLSRDCAVPGHGWNAIRHGFPPSVRPGINSRLAFSMNAPANAAPNNGVRNGK
jgi:hypothetical protein